MNPCAARSSTRGVSVSSRRTGRARLWAIPSRSRRSPPRSGVPMNRTPRAGWDRQRPILVTSRRQPASSVFIKAIQVLRHGLVPPQPYFTKLNPHISLDGTRLAVPTALTPAYPGVALPALRRCEFIRRRRNQREHHRRGSAKAPAPRRAGASRADAYRILPLSAQSPAALEALVKSWTDVPRGNAGCHSTICVTRRRVRRTHYDYRVAVTGRSKEELPRPSGALSTNASMSACARACARRVSGSSSAARGRNGSRWVASSSKTEARFPRRSRILRRVAAAARRMVVAGGTEPTRRSARGSPETEIAQPALFAIQVGLAALWKSWGVSPGLRRRP